MACLGGDGRGFFASGAFQIGYQRNRFGIFAGHSNGIKIVPDTICVCHSSLQLWAPCGGNTCSCHRTPEQILRHLHRDTGLTGRTHLWSLSLKAVARQPWFGYGFRSFWLGMKGASATLVQQLHWSPPSGHNGFLDITLEVGIVGLALFLIGYLLLWRRAFQFLSRDRSHVPSNTQPNQVNREH